MNSDEERRSGSNTLMTLLAVYDGKTDWTVCTWGSKKYHHTCETENFPMHDPCDPEERNYGTSHCYLEYPYELQRTLRTIQRGSVIIHLPPPPPPLILLLLRPRVP